MSKRQDVSDNSTQVVLPETSARTSASTKSQIPVTGTENVDKLSSEKDFSVEPIYVNTSNPNDMEAAALGKVSLYRSPSRLRLKRLPDDVSPVPHGRQESNDLIFFFPEVWAH